MTVEQTSTAVEAQREATGNAAVDMIDAPVINIDTFVHPVARSNRLYGRWTTAAT